MDARYYGSNMGRFMSPDPVFATVNRLYDPQQWNMYSYGRNNPLSNSDPTGLVPERSIWAIIEPRGISGQPGFTEADQMCVFRSRHFGQSNRFGDRCRKVSKYRTVLNYSNLHNFLARIQAFFSYKLKSLAQSSFPDGWYLRPSNGESPGIRMNTDSSFRSLRVSLRKVPTPSACVPVRKRRSAQRNRNQRSFRSDTRYPEGGELRIWS